LQIRISTGETDEKKAAKFLKRKLAEVLTGTHVDARNLRYEDLRDGFLSDFEANGRKSLRRDSAGNVFVDCVKRLDGFFVGYKASEIDADAIRKFQLGLKSQGLANGSVNRSVSALRRMFSLARREERIRDVPFFPFLKESPARSGFIERADYERLFSALPAYLKPVLALGFWTGMRRAEILNVQWNQIDFVGRTIRLHSGSTKNDAGRTIPVARPLGAILFEQFQRRDPQCPYVCFFIDRRGHAGQVGNFRKSWQNTCVKLGLASWEETGEAALRSDRPHSSPKNKLLYRGLLFHDLRRSCVRNLVRAQVPERIAQEITGHKSRSVFDRYDIVSENDLMNAGAKLETYLQKFGDNSGTDVHQNVAGGSVVN
jgi:integrase